MKKVYFTGYLTQEGNGIYKLSGNPLQNGQVVEVMYGKEFAEYVIDYLGSGEYILIPVGGGAVLRNWFKARVDVAEFKLPDRRITGSRDPQNYEMLSRFLNSKRAVVSVQEFNALLRVLNLITKRGLTKGLAIKKAAVEFSVTQNYLRGWIRKMPVVSNLEAEMKKGVGSLAAYDRGIARKIKNRMEIEFL